uniref:ubiquitinyl hydrolase 1 n=1 Tax=Glossina pallidipes TaxID=7398 RepID=A0A1B0A4S9_GLOPL
MEKETESKLALLNRKTDLALHQTEEFSSDGDEKESISVEKGTPVKIFQFKSAKNKNVSIVQVLDFVNKIPIYENLYECPTCNLSRVDKYLWPFIIAIVEPEHRMCLLKEEQHGKWLTSLKVKDFVTVPGQLFSKSHKRYDCIVRYIGPVPELYPVGYFFGLEVLNENTSPQAEKIPFSKTYMHVEPKYAIITTANWIHPSTSDSRKKYPTPTCDFFAETIGKVKSVIENNTNVSSLKREKKTKQKEPTALFYDTPESFTNANSNERERKHNEYELISDNGECREVNIQNEKKYERRRSSVQTQTQYPSSILKNKKSNSAIRKEQNTKSTSHMNLGNPEIVFIDGEEYNKEEPVIVVPKNNKEKSEIDFSDLLGTAWPKHAGGFGSILDRSTGRPLRGGQEKLYSNEASRSASARNGIEKDNENKLTTVATIKENDSKNQKKLTEYNNKTSARYGDRTRKMETDRASTLSPNEISLYDYIPLTVLELFTSIPVDFGCGSNHSDIWYSNVEGQNPPSMEMVPGTTLTIGSLVTVDTPTSNEYGVIRWIGIPPGKTSIKVGVEMEEENDDNNFPDHDSACDTLFKSFEGRGRFVSPERCKIDPRYSNADTCNIVAKDTSSDIEIENGAQVENAAMFGQKNSPVIPGAVAPIKCLSLDCLEGFCGKFKGIQGHHNSCYLDVTLFSMFAFTSVFDAILFRAREPQDIKSYTEVQTVLREEIVNPLRKYMFVRADRVMKLRKLLEKLSSVSGLTSEEKDPEEFLNCLLAQIMRAEPFLKLNSGQETYYYQLFVEKDEHLSFPSVQQLFEQSFWASDIKLNDVPSCLIIQMPRFGKNYKMYSRILPSQVLDVTDIIANSPRQCTVCGKLAEHECRDCFGVIQRGSGLESTAFCSLCLKTVHSHVKRSSHTSRALEIPQDFRLMADNTTIPRLYMELFAVVCIETSHYVTFVKSGSGPDAPWCFFDSMADRNGEQNGYNIPEMVIVPDMPQWLSEDGALFVHESSSTDKMLPEHAKRLFCDAYMCMYQSSDVMMYR